MADSLRALRRPIHAVDIGANVGLFGVFLLELFPDAEVTAFEPDRANAAVHRHVIRENERERSWRLRTACASNANGWLPFRGDDFSGSSIVADHEADAAERARSEDVMDLLAGADLVKIDAEGGEWALLTDPRLHDVSARAFVLEYHPHLCPGDDPRGLAESLLAAAGYTTANLFHRADGVGMLWAWRP